MTEPINSEIVKASQNLCDGLPPWQMPSPERDLEFPFLCTKSDFPLLAWARKSLSSAEQAGWSRDELGQWVKSLLKPESKSTSKPALLWWQELRRHGGEQNGGLTRSLARVQSLFDALVAIDQNLFASLEPLTSFEREIHAAIRLDSLKSPWHRLGQSSVKVVYADATDGGSGGILDLSVEVLAPNLAYAPLGQDDGVRHVVAAHNGCVWFKNDWLEGIDLAMAVAFKLVGELSGGKLIPSDWRLRWGLDLEPTWKARALTIGRDTNLADPTTPALMKDVASWIPSGKSASAAFAIAASTALAKALQERLPLK